jgi:hypothetical protein
MKTKKLFLATACLFLIIAIQAQHQLILQPNATDGKDVKIRGRADELNLNIPDDKVIHLYAWTNSGVPNKQRIFIQFDWSALPQNAVIDSAVLTMYHTSLNNTPDHSGANEFWIRRVTGHWAEDSITWNNQPGVDTTNQVYIPQSISSTQDYHMNVTQLVKDIISSGNNYGFRMSLNDESPHRNVSLASSDHPDTTKHPKLVIYYTTSNTSVESIDRKSDVVIYPNPVDSDLKFSFRETEIKSGEIKIYNSTGQLVKRFYLVNSNSIVVNCNEFSNGVYYYTFSEINNTTISGKFIVSK